ncbi:FadR family transcriptional regulator [Dactylosporangium aurantiacum]|uniref:FadR family transcriptional regulator n=1 Tax=Dactylosporangium aurantiacum TaxID=35754 RepID=A0A9Q9ISS1_9ACTN|nr:FCD domain-containing protein [Dactylosporangium aurantiacum]MDG6107662.1 FCD domain-containing protein [Dactylosporangium aurantiacum]UWZ58744.1 FadR family transcriptional regulator [Dactylosporangium aurantiacum]
MTPPNADHRSFGRTMSALGRRIVLGRLDPGAVLDVGEIGAEFDVSRTVVREVLRGLGAKGLVDARPKRGTIVAPRAQWQLLDSDVLRWRFTDGVDETFLTELFELRLAVEPAVARLAAERRDDHDMATLYQALGDMRSAQVPDEHVEADLAFHRALLAAAHNELFATLGPVIEAGLRVRDRFVHSVTSDTAPEEHAAVLEAVRRRRPAAAESAMRALLVRSAADVEKAREGADA